NSSSSLQDGAKYIIGKMVDSDGELVDNDSSVVNCVGMQYTNNSRAVWICSGNASDGYQLRNEASGGTLAIHPTTWELCSSSTYGYYTGCFLDDYGRLCIMTNYDNSRQVSGGVYKEVH
ncbi:MAG: hypothetical protein IJS47_05000, partial [Clostridia bacterium]|nr:hypothetical protein [Clostridia bacterium]